MIFTFKCLAFKVKPLFQLSLGKYTDTELIHKFLLRSDYHQPFVVFVKQKQKIMAIENL